VGAFYFKDDGGGGSYSSLTGTVTIPTGVTVIPIIVFMAALSPRWFLKGRLLPSGIMLLLER
jgi:hypothetical protein